MATTRLPRDFKEFLQSLNSNGVEYLVLGGYAVIYHGYPRSTGDLDVWIAVNPENASKVATALAEFGFTAGIKPDLFLQDHKVFRMGVPPFRIELLTTPSGVVFTEAYSRRVRTDIDGVPINVISLDDLKVNKRASGRPKDLNDLQNLP